VSVIAKSNSLIRYSRRTPTLIPGIILCLLVFLPLVFGRLFVDIDQAKVFSAERNLPPSLEHPLGTQSEGRDMLAAMIVAAPATIRIGLIGGTVGLLVGVVLGLTSGYLGGVIDTVIRTIVDVGLTIPSLAIMLIIAASLEKITLTTMGLIIAATSWMFTTRVIRSQVLSLRERGFVRMTKLSACGHPHIIFVELMPNLIPIIAARFVDSIIVAILAAIGLEVLALGSQNMTLGTTIHFALLNTALSKGLWWWWLPPIIILVALFLGLFLLSIALDEIANPRLRR
jgi:peptide/nickel transport system permease protein